MRPCSPGGTTKAAARSPSAATPTCRTSSDTASARPRRWPRHTAFDPATTPTTSGDASTEQQPETYRDRAGTPRPAVPPIADGPDNFTRPLTPGGLRQPDELVDALTGLRPATVW